MPDIGTTPQVLHNALDPYHVEFDNLPLKNLRRIIEIVNAQVDINSEAIRSSIGTAGSLGNRISQSLNDNGSLRTTAVDSAAHNIAAHTDGTATLSTDDIEDFGDMGYTLTNPVEFVKMLGVERTKLSGIAEDATAFSLEVPGATPSEVVLFDNHSVKIHNSDTVSWVVTAPNIVKAHLAFDPDAAHQHAYNQTPTSIQTDPQHANYNKVYRVTSTAVPYMEDSLRVFVNGFRIPVGNSGINIPSASSGFTGARAVYVASADHEAGTFTLNVKLADGDVIRTDFDIALE